MSDTVKTAVRGRLSVDPALVLKVTATPAKVIAAAAVLPPRDPIAV